MRELFDTDFLGNKIEIGDTVIFEAPHYRDFCVGKVITKAPKSCQIEYINNWNYPTEGRQMVCRQYYGQIIKMPEKESNSCEGCKHIGFRYPYASMYPCNNCRRANPRDYYNVELQKEF